MGIGSKTCQAPKPQAVRSVGWEEDIGRREDMEDGFIFIDEYSVEPREFDEVPKKTTKKKSLTSHDLITIFDVEVQLRWQSKELLLCSLRRREPPTPLNPFLFEVMVGDNAWSTCCVTYISDWFQVFRSDFRLPRFLSLFERLVA